MKHFIAILVVLGLAVFGFFFFTPGQVHERPELNDETAQNLYTQEEETSLTAFRNDSAALEALKQCESAQITMADCIASLRRNNYEVTGLAPKHVGDDGFQGLMVFPMQSGSTVIMDYNTKDRSKQFMYFGSYASLKQAVEDQQLDLRSQANLSALEYIIRD